MKFCPYFSQRLVNLLNLVHGKSEHWKQCVIPFSKQHKWNVLHFSQREPFCSAPLQGLFSLVYMFHFYYIASFLKEWTGCQAYF